MQPPVATEAELHQGWAEREILFYDGTLESARIHALTQSELISLTKFSQAEVLAIGIQKSLRRDRDSVARICAASQLVISAMLAQLCVRSVGGFAPIVQTTVTGNTVNHG